MSSTNSSYDYQYFCGANVNVMINGSELDAVGISYQVTYSKQPIYSYFSRLYDAVLDGKEMVQGKFVINFSGSNYMKQIFLSNGGIESFSEAGLFDINITFGFNPMSPKIQIKNCFILGHGQTIQIDDTVILTEYSFIGRNIETQN
jgi:hypothetical protein